MAKKTEDEEKQIQESFFQHVTRQKIKDKLPKTICKDSCILLLTTFFSICNTNNYRAI